MAFNFSNGDTLSSKYLKESDLIDDYIGNRLWSWGYNPYGNLGTNNTTDRSSPVQTVSSGTNWKQGSTTTYTFTGIKSDGTLWTWGYNNKGQLGTNDITHRSSPVQTVSGGTNWRLCASGKYHSAGIKTDGTLWLWGINSIGHLATNNTTDRSSPVQTVSGGTNWRQVAVNTFHTAAIKTDGTLWGWGYNPDGQLGDNTSTFGYSSPIQTVSSGTSWKQVSCSQLATHAIKTDGTLWLWGGNQYGALGDNTTTKKSSPVQTVSGGTNWKLVSGGGYFVSATKTDGTLWVWGDNSFGQLGDNTRTNRSSPVQTVSSGTNWKSVAAGVYSTTALKTDGTLWVWGRNPFGNLGDNTTVDKSSPIQTVAGGTNWKQISTGLYTVFGITFSDQQ